MDREGLLSSAGYTRKQNENPVFQLLGVGGRCIWRIAKIKKETVLLDPLLIYSNFTLQRLLGFNWTFAWHFPRPVSRSREGNKQQWTECKCRPLWKLPSPYGKSPKGNLISTANVWNILMHLHSSICSLTDNRDHSFRRQDDDGVENCTQNSCNTVRINTCIKEGFC